MGRCVCLRVVELLAVFYACVIDSPEQTNVRVCERAFSSGGLSYCFFVSFNYRTPHLAEG